MSHSQYLRRAILTLFCCAIFGCAAKQPPPPPPLAPPPPPPRPTWSGEKAQIAVVSFDDKVSAKPPKKGKTKSQQSRNLIGRGMENQLVTTLRQAGQFVVTETPKRSVRNKRGKVSAVRIDTIEGAEFLLSGSVTKYLPSQESLSAGVEHDPLLGAFSSDINATMIQAAGATFATFTPTPEDRVEISLHLIDAKSGRLVSETTIEAAPQDLGSSLEGLFGPELLNLSGELSTPLQKAVRANNIKAVNWIADNCLAYRKQLAENPPPEPPKPLEKRRGIK
jgi:curli biogenesis system outer membrane secretion channel CsgG